MKGRPPYMNTIGLPRSLVSSKTSPSAVALHHAAQKHGVHAKEPLSEYAERSAIYKKYIGS